MSNYALQINNLSATIGDFSLKEIDLKIEKGTIMGFVGRNGAGKTTLINTILGLIPTDNGEILFFDKRMQDHEVETKMRVAVVLDTFMYNLYQKPKNVIKNIAPFYKEFDLKLFHDLMAKFELDKRKRFKDYSKGMRTKFSIVMALAQQADLIILDEPTSGLDPIARTEFLDLLYDVIQDENKTIFFSTHITSDLYKIADHICLIRDGKILFSEEKDTLLDRYTHYYLAKSDMTDEIRNIIPQAKETAFGFEGISIEKEKLSQFTDIKMKRPTIEDVFVQWEAFKC